MTGFVLSHIEMGRLKAGVLEDVSQNNPASDVHAHLFQGERNLFWKNSTITFFLIISGLRPIRGWLGELAALCPHGLPSRDRPFQLGMLGICSSVSKGRAGTPASLLCLGPCVCCPAEEQKKPPSSPQSRPLPWGGPSAGLGGAYSVRPIFLPGCSPFLGSPALCSLNS